MLDQEILGVQRVSCHVPATGIVFFIPVFIFDIYMFIRTHEMLTWYQVPYEIAVPQSGRIFSDIIVNFVHTLPFAVT